MLFRSEPKKEEVVVEAPPEPHVADVSAPVVSEPVALETPDEEKPAYTRGDL